MNELFQDWLMRFALGGGCACVSLLIAIAARRRLREAQRMMRRLPPWQRAAMACLLAVCLAYGGTKTNQVDGAGLGLRSMSTVEDNILCTTTTSDYDYHPPTVTPEDIARGWQVWEVRTNAAVDYAMPEGAVLASNWWMRGAYEDVVRIGNGDQGTGNGEWLFPFGTNEYSSLWAFSWGKARFALASTNAEIVAVGAPMSAVPYRSRLWSAAGADGSRLVTWENFALNRDTNTPVNAQIELRSNGDFVTRSNEVETVCRRVDDFDWDGDGIPNWDDGDPYRHDGDHTGQADGWAEYVDETVGTGLENGYYKLTATFPQTGFRRTLLTVGWHEVVVAEPGEYVFLLEKGRGYGIGLRPFAEGVEFAAVDDIPAAAPLLSAGSRPSWSGRWTVDEGRCVIDPPRTNLNGRIIWLPKLRVTPGTWSPAGGVSSKTFTAELYDWGVGASGATYRWQSCNASLAVGSPSSVSTEMTWRGNGQVAGCVARLEASVAGERLESELVFGFNGSGGSDGEDSGTGFDFALNVPEALLVNSNEVMSLKIGRIRMNLRGAIPSGGTLVLRPAAGGECVRLTGQSAWTVTPASASAGMEFETQIEGVRACTSLGGVELEAVLELPEGDQVCGRSRLTVIEVGGVIFPDEPDGRPVVAPGRWVPFGLEIFPSAAASLVRTEYDVRQMGEDGEFSGWRRVGSGDSHTAGCGFNPASRGIWQVRGTAGLEPEGCPHGTDERDTLFGSDEPAYVYVPRGPRLVFDYDRDGVIGTNDVAKAKCGDAVFRFWINDDNDSGDTNDSANDRPGFGSNCDDGQVNGRGDLLDFTPVWMDFSDVFPTGTPAQVWNKIEWRIASSCVNVVWSNLGRAAAGLFQREGDLYEFGPQLYDLPECADVTDIYDGVVIPDSLRGTSETEGGVFLIEGWSPGLDLTLEGWRANRSQNEQEWLVTSEANICITGVERMYRFASLRGAAENPALNVNVPSVPLNQPDGTKDLDVFFTHGFRVSEPDAHAWGAEVFKRLWQSGSNADFHMLAWRGDYGMIDSALHYQHNAWLAQRTGGALKRYVEIAQPVAAKRVLMTQSLGNMVACEALREGLQVGKYFMFNAAVPSEAIDPSLQDANAAIRSKYVPSAWHVYPTLSWAANWFRWFVNDPNDARGKMGWPGRFSDAFENVPEVYNYYSTGDEIFHETASPPAVLDGVPESFSSYSWQKQETHKGLKDIAGTVEGGWGLRMLNYDPPVCYSADEAAAMVADGAIPDAPVFNCEFVPMLLSNASVDDQWYALAKCVPAVSSAIGGNVVAADNIFESHNLNGSGYRDEWGREAEKDGSRPWKHSDMKDMAYFYVYKLYNELVESDKGDLK